MPSIVNKFFRIEIDETSGALRSMADLVHGDELIKHSEAIEYAPIRVVCLDSAGARREFVPSAVSSLKASESSLRVQHLAFRPIDGRSDEIAIAANWSIESIDEPSEPSAATIWRLSLDNRTTDLQVVEVLFPFVRGIVLGSDHRKSVLVFPHHAGEKIANPVEELTSRRYLEFWRARTIVEADGVYSREINYCGLASMTWMDLYTNESNASRGLYMASYDPTFVLTGVRSETGGPEKPWCGFSFRKHVPVGPKATWDSSPYVVALHEGDWHWGAMQYRNWIRKHIVLHDVQNDLLSESALCPRYDFKNDSVVRHRFEEIPSMYDQAAAEGMDHLFISGWNRSGFDTDYPEYVPDMELGSSWELAQGCRYIKEQGGKASFYINVRLFDLESDFFERLGQHWALKDYTGDLYRESYGPRTFAVLCPSNDQWRKWAVDTASWMSKAFGARGIYLDQLGSAEPFPCYDREHNHVIEGVHHHGLYNHGYLRMIREIRDRLAEIDPTAFLMIENCGDIYSQYLYANLTWNGTDYDEFFNMYKYTFPEFIQINMVNPRRIDDDTERSAWFYRDMARAFVLGSVFWAELGDRFGAENQHLLEYFRIGLRLRQQAASFISSGVYRDTDGIELVDGDGSDLAPRACWSLSGDASDTGIDWNSLPYRDLTRMTASRWELPRGGALLMISNPVELAGRHVRINCLAPGCWRPGMKMQLLQEQLGGIHDDREIALDGDARATLEIPSSKLSFIVLLPEVQA
ncbi:MAG: DUF6259 domain-containing protein [Clostridia bacterium]|nr:DUF6259 domain-containing protein [Clostridia bacterium]